MELTTKEVITPSSVAIRYGLLTGLVSVLISFALYALQLEQNAFLKFLTTIVLLLGIVLAQREYRQRNAGFMSYGEGLRIGALVSVIVGVLGAAFVYVYTTLIDPDTMTRTIERARAELEAKGSMSDAQIDQAMAMSAKFTSGPFMLIFVIVGTLFFGLLISLITSAFVKNPKPEFE
ncbi:MAG: DUF4199 domain-containing protein [Janthinobacterium lividum]